VVSKVAAAESLLGVDLAGWGVVPASELPGCAELTTVPVALRLAELLPQGGLPRGVCNCSSE
jgi:hypothetical protein